MVEVGPVPHSTPACQFTQQHLVLRLALSAAKVEYMHPRHARQWKQQPAWHVTILDHHRVETGDCALTASCYCSSATASCYCRRLSPPVSTDMPPLLASSVSSPLSTALTPAPELSLIRPEALALAQM